MPFCEAMILVISPQLGWWVKMLTTAVDLMPDAHVQANSPPLTLNGKSRGSWEAS